jgi:hypothetical protein
MVKLCFVSADPQRMVLASAEVNLPSWRVKPTFLVSGGGMRDLRGTLLGVRVT